MKLIGENSASKYLSYFFFVLFCIVCFHFVYEMIGFAVCYYNLKTDNQLMSNFFILGNDVGWFKNQWTKPMNDLLKFKFYYPFTEQNLFTGIFSLATFLITFVNGLFMSTLLFTLYKILKELSKEKFFNTQTISWLKRFAIINIAYFPVYLVVWMLITRNIFTPTPFFTFFIFLLGIFMLFIIEFFKKGYELQSENDLTI